MTNAAKKFNYFCALILILNAITITSKNVLAAEALFIGHGFAHAMFIRSGVPVTHARWPSQSDFWPSRPAFGDLHIVCLTSTDVAAEESKMMCPMKKGGGLELRANT